MAEHSFRELYGMRNRWRDIIHLKKQRTTTKTHRQKCIYHSKAHICTANTHILLIAWIWNGRNFSYTHMCVVCTTVDVYTPSERMTREEKKCKTKPNRNKTTETTVNDKRRKYNARTHTRFVFQFIEYSWIYCVCFFDEYVSLCVWLYRAMCNLFYLSYPSPVLLRRAL